ncbi:MAG: M23 family metallopeptidase [Candidatus Margulisbacteria bacterium]|jgi:murein DD-endopeptidase MepM/ murein hydrolase activator NlpD|nr:M23 family metallopeptidase [Candidatus Margulisiibacteriota bacterium]
MKEAKRQIEQRGYISFAFCSSDRHAPLYFGFSFATLAAILVLSALLCFFTFYVARHTVYFLQATADYQNIISQNQLLHTKIRIAAEKQAQVKAHIHELKTREEEIKELVNNGFTEMQPSEKELSAYPLITTHRIVSQAGEFGRVLIDNAIVVEYFDDSAKPLAFQRALVTAEKLKELLASRTTLRKYRVKKSGNSIYAYINEQPIFVVLNADTARLREPLSQQKLAEHWLRSIKSALAGQQEKISWLDKIPFRRQERRRQNTLYKTLYPSINYPAYSVALDSSETNQRLKQVEHLLKMSLQEITAYRKSFEELQANVRAYQRRFDYTPSIFPVKNSYIYSDFGWRHHPIANAPRFHRGVDLPAWHGAPIYAAAAGVVINSGWSTSLGYYVEIEHSSGFSTLYGHNSANLAAAGQKVEKGQLIARVGSTGLSNGNHCHYEVHYYNRPVNPTRFLNLNVFTAQGNL